MSYRAYMQIEQEKQRKAVDRYQRSNIKSVEEAEKLAARYWNQFCEDHSDKNQCLMYWSRSVVLGAKIASGQINRIWRKPYTGGTWKNRDAEQLS